MSLFIILIILLIIKSKLRHYLYRFWLCFLKNSVRETEAVDVYNGITSQLCHVKNGTVGVYNGILKNRSTV